MDEGTDPDHRFSLANERTFLAWIRTSLSLLAAAVAVAQLVPEFRVPGARIVLGVVLALSSVAVAAASYRRWSGIERSMRNGTPMPYSPLLLIVATALVGTGIVVTLLVLFASG